jgi:hypothetical protein
MSPRCRGLDTTSTVASIDLTMPRVACGQLGENERLGHVIVGAAVQSDHSLFRGSLGAQDQDRKLSLSRADVTQYLKPGSTGA